MLFDSHTTLVLQQKVKKKKIRFPQFSVQDREIHKTVHVCVTTKACTQVYMQCIHTHTHTHTHAYTTYVRVCASVMSDSLQPYGRQPARVLCPWDSPGKNTGVGFHALLQENFLTQGRNPRLLGLMNWQVGSLPLVLPGKPM